MIDNNTLQAAEEVLGLTFNNKQLLSTALTHKSFSKQKVNMMHPHNERLEFLGDAVLKLIVSEYLFEQHPQENEGYLTKVRAKLIADNFLGEIAKSIQLGSYMRFSYGEIQTGGETRLSNLANAFEAILGACYLDQGYDAAKSLYHRMIQPLGDDIFVQQTDYKSELQEYIQRLHCELPVYEIVHEEGPDHDKTFKVNVVFTIKGKDHQFSGEGVTKKAAHQAAAKEALLFLNQTPEL